jgi:hypothetical protein
LPTSPGPLAARATVDFTDSSLREILNWLRESQQLVVLLENDALSGIGVMPGDPVSDRLDDAPVYLLLNRLRTLGIAWYFEDDILHVTSVEAADERQTTVPYSIGDLRDAGYELDDVQQVIEKAIAPDSWESAGGNGVISFLGDVMFIRQTDQYHRELRGLLSALREHGRQTFVLDPPQHLRLREKLEEMTTVAFRDTPLEAAVKQLSDSMQIDIRLDLPALRSSDIRERAPITLSLNDRQLKTVLEAMLIDLHLTWVLRDGVLWVTSHDEAEQLLKTAVFDVRDLCRDYGESNALTEAIVTQTEPVWSDVGGPGLLHFARPGTLVVHSTERSLGEVRNLLETYRTALRTSKPRPRDEDDPNKVTTVYYRMHSGVANDLSFLLPRLVRPETWKSPQQPEAQGEILLATSAPEVQPGGAKKAAAEEQDATTQALLIARSVLIIQQTQAAHDEIAEVIRRVESGDPPAFVGGGFGGGGFGGGFFSAPANRPHKSPRK